MIEKIKLVNEMKLRNFSKETIKTYLYYNEKFLEHIKKTPKYITQKDVENYILDLYEKEKSSSTRHLATASLNFYYCIVLKRKFRLKYPKREKRIPLVLTKSEILKLINSLNNPKHKLLIELIYSSGLRVSEVITVKHQHILMNEKLLIIRQGKGKKDRFTILSNRFLQNYFLLEKKSDYLFYTNRNYKKHITKRTAEKILEIAKKKAKINKRVFPHKLRASFATHLYENGTDIYLIQKLLGHADFSTTQRYLSHSPKNIKNIKSPLD